MFETGDEVVSMFLANFSFFLGIIGLILLAITPFYFVKIYRSKNFSNMGKPFITGMIGLAFLVVWLSNYA